MTNFKGNYVTKEDVRIAKNYLSEREFEIYRQREMKALESDFDKEMKKLKER